MQNKFKNHVKNNRTQSVLSSLFDKFVLEFIAMGRYTLKDFNIINEFERIMEIEQPETQYITQLFLKSDAFNQNKYEQYCLSFFSNCMYNLFRVSGNKIIKNSYFIFVNNQQNYFEELYNIFKKILCEPINSTLSKTSQQNNELKTSQQNNELKTPEQTQNIELETNLTCLASLILNRKVKNKQCVNKIIYKHINKSIAIPVDTKNILALNLDKKLVLNYFDIDCNQFAYFLFSRFSFFDIENKKLFNLKLQSYIK